MAYDKVIDSSALDANLASIAEAIRTKGGTTDQLVFPAGFISAIEAIEAGGGGISPFGKIAASGEITFSEDVTGTYKFSTGASLKYSILYGAIIYRDDPLETEDISKLYNTLLFSLYARVSNINNGGYTLKINAGLGGSGQNVGASPSAAYYGRISNVDTNGRTITFSDLVASGNYAICLKAGVKYKWAIIDPEGVN